MNALTLARSSAAARRLSVSDDKNDAAVEDLRADNRRLLVDLRVWIADACFASLVLTRWVSVTLLATMGLYVLFFLALGDFTPEGAFAQLDNLARRYLEASPDRQASFLRGTAGVSVLLFLVLASCRWRSLTVHFTQGKGQHHG